MATSAPKPAPLYAFDLPSDLVARLEPCDALTPRVKSTLPSAAAPAPLGDGAAAKGQGKGPGAAGRSCTTCPSAPTFASPRDQRLHYQSDWHRFNALLAARGHTEQRLSAAAFEEQLDRLDAAEDDEEADWDDPSGWDPLVRLLRSLGLATPADAAAGSDGGARASSSSDDEDAEGGLLDSEAAHLWFAPAATTAGNGTTAAAAAWTDTQVGVHRALFEDLTEQTNPMDYALYMVRNMHVGQILRYAPGSAAAKTDPRIGPNTVGARFRGKRLQGGVQDVGKRAQFAILDGHGFIPGLRLTAQEEEQAAQSDSSTSSSASSTSSASSLSRVGGAGGDRGVDTGFVEPLAAPALPADPPLRLWTIIMMGGGHFAATVVMLNPYVTVTPSKRKGERRERSLVVLAHRTIHKYTTRRKQGGGQSAQDASGKFAKSAGAQLRRAGEEALKNEIRELLDLPGWRALLARSERVWFRSSMRAAKDVLWSWEAARQPSPLDAARAEGRLSTLPIATRRPTIEECVRCFFELTRVRATHYTPEQLTEMQRVREQTANEAEVRATRRKLAAQAKASKAANTTVPSKKAKAEASAEEKARRARWERFIEMVYKRKEGAAMGFLAKHEWDTLEPPAAPASTAGDLASASPKKSTGPELTVDSPLPTWWVDEQVKAATKPHTLIPVTLLQLAAENDLPNLVETLLVEHRANPTLPVLETGVDVGANADATADANADATTQNKDTGSGTGAGTPGVGAAQHRTAYDLAASKAVRDVFLTMQASQPMWWDWAGTGPGGARVVPLSAEDKAAEQGRGTRTTLRPEAAKGRRNAMRDKVKARAAVAAAALSTTVSSDEDEDADADAGPSSTPRGSASSPVPPSSDRANRLGGPGPAVPRALRQQLADTSISPAMRARIEREKRARAAEERMRRLQGN